MQTHTIYIYNIYIHTHTHSHSHTHTHTIYITITDIKLNELSEKLQVVYRISDVQDGPHVRALGVFRGRKQFIPDDSLLSKMLLYDDENYKTIFNIMICVLLLWGLSIAYHDLEQEGLPNYDLLIWGIFRDLEIFLKYWALMFFSSYFIVILSHFALTARYTLVYYVILCVYMAVQIGAFIYSAWVINSRETPFAMPLAIGFMAGMGVWGYFVYFSYMRPKSLYHTH